MRKLIFLISILMMAGCQPKSEVDKCVEAVVKADGPYGNKEDKNISEADARLECLKAQAGK
jgi:hypothetical protein